MTFRIEPFSIRLSAPLATAKGTIERREGFLVVLDGGGGVRGEGVRGVGESTPLAGWTEPLEACRRALASVPLDGCDAHCAGTPAASHGVQGALLDAQARERGVRLADLLAAEFAEGAARPPERVPVNATVGDGTVDETVEAAIGAVADGFDCLKLKVGSGTLESDLARLRAVRDAVDASIRLDANGAWTRDTARRAIDAAEDMGVEYVEQPLPAADLEGLAALRGRGVDIAVDESLATEGVRAVLDAEAADAAILKPMALGGPGAAVGVARLLRSNGVEPIVTTTVDAAVARAAAVHVAAVIPDVRHCGLATADLLASDLCRDPAPITDGYASVPSGPGTHDLDALDLDSAERPG